ncbi:MAG: hypothetical protein IEMM0008_1442 [bacterium]|nr:MAG: hypothetical protein IEMM0008_1442 [bacterium]
MFIQIGKGIDNLFFGMSEEKVTRILGKPDKIYFSQDTKDKYLQYNQLELVLQLYFKRL